MPLPFFRGWLVVTGSFLVMLVIFGIAYSFAAFFQPLQREFAATRADVSLIFSLAAFLYFGLGALAGPLADRIGARRVILAGIVAIAIGLLAASQSMTLWQIYVAYGVSVGVGVGLAYVPSVGVVQRWFVRRRGFASGLAVAGIGVGTLITPPLAGLLIGWLDWRGAYIALAALTLVVGVAGAWLIEDSPARHGLQPDGDAAPPGPAQPARGVTLRGALRAGPFWLLYAAVVSTGFGMFIPFVHLAAYAQDRGVPEAAALSLIGLIGIGSVAGRFVLGGAADRMGRRHSLTFMFAGMAAMLLIWLAAESWWSLAGFALVFGIFYGGFVALVPALAMDYFGPKHAGAIIGALYTGAGIGTFIGPTLAGLAFDWQQSYTLPIVGGVAFNLVAVLCMMLLVDPARWRARALQEAA